MFTVGERVRIIGRMNDPDPLPIGSEGTVTWFNPLSGGSWQLAVKWDSGRSLMLLPEDQSIFTVLS